MIIRIAAILSCLLATARPPLLAGNAPLRFYHWTPSEGLCHNNVRGLHISAEGFLYLATWNGLCRFDGYQFTEIRQEEQHPGFYWPARSPIPFEDQANTIAPLPGGAALVGSRHSILRLDTRTGAISALFPRPGPNKSMMDFAIGSDSSVYYITGDGFKIQKHLFRISPDLRELDTLLFQQADISAINCMSWYRDSLWLGTQTEVVSVPISSRAVAPVLVLQPSFTPPISAMTTSCKRLFVADKQGIKTKTGQQTKSIPGSSPEDIGQVMTLLADSRHRLWIGTSRGLWLVEDPEQAQAPRHVPLAPLSAAPAVEDQVNCLLEDGYGNLWIGTLSHGLFCLPGQSMPIQTTFVDEFGAPPGARVFGIHETQEGRLMLGTTSGLYVQTASGTYAPVHLPVSQPDTVMALLRLQDQEFLLALRSGTLIRGLLQDEKLIPLQILSTDSIYGRRLILREMRQHPVTGDVWIATEGGAWRLSLDHAGELVPVQLYREYIPYSWSIAFDAAGRTWIGNRGLSAVDLQGQERHFHAPEVGLDSDLMSAVSTAVLPSGRIYVGSFGAGVYTMQPDSGTASQHYHAGHGLPNGLVMCMALEGEKRLWLGTGNGLACLDLKDERIHSFGAAWGAHIREFESGASFVRANGNLCLGGRDGFVEISRRLDGEMWELPSGKLIPGEVLTPAGRVLPEMEAPGTWTVTLPAGTRHAALQLRNHNLVAARHSTFHLWDADGKALVRPEPENPFVDLHHMEPGVYPYRMALKPDGSDGAVDVRVYIESFWYQRWWALLLFWGLPLALVALLAWSWYRYAEERRKRRMEAQTALLQSQNLRARLNQHFVFNSLNAMQEFIGAHDPDATRSFIADFGKLLRTALTVDEDTFFSLQEELELSMTYLRLEQQRLSTRKILEIKMETDPALSLSDISCPAFLLQPFLENAIWHGIVPQKEAASSPGRIEITVRDNGETVRIELLDNGVGLEAASHHRPSWKAGKPSQGLELVRKRLQHLEACGWGAHSFSIEDRLGPGGKVLGTQVLLFLPKEAP